MKRRPFNEKQLKILKLRARGFTQRETAKKLGTSRANVSMVEWRLRKKLEKARETINAFESLLLSQKISVRKSKTGEGTREKGLSAKGSNNLQLNDERRTGASK